MRLHNFLGDSLVDTDSTPSRRYYLSQQLAIADLRAVTFAPLGDREAKSIHGGIAAPDRVVPENFTPAPTPSVHPPTPGHPPSDLHWSPTLQNVLDRPSSNLPWHLAAAGVLFCSVFAAWAWFGQIQEVSTAAGKLIPKGEVYKVQPTAQAEVSRVLIRAGERVEAGQILAELDQRLELNEIAGLQESIQADQLELIQTKGLIAQAQLEMQTRQAISAAQMQSQVAAIAEVQTDANTYRQLLTDLQAEMTAYQSRLDRLQPLVDEGAIAQDHLFEVEQTLRQRQQTVTQNQGNLQKVSASGAQLQAKLAQAEAEGQQSQLEAQQKLQQLTIQVSQLQSKIAATENSLKAAKTKLKYKFIHAPVNGIVTDLNVHNIGEVTKPGETFAEIMPNGASLVLSAFLPNQEAGFVKKGMTVRMKFNAFPYQRYGTVSGKVLFIAPDATIDEQLGSGYRIEVALDQSTIGTQATLLKAGQTATAEIVTRQRRIVDILFEPLKQLQKNGLSL
ncbi:MAG: HlyD family efflux transporter periplasmic adaptor subunit [Timaviella obliquedivisa GSE-PSE-MK23-08B]|jgi:HlyD family type I secretion membrane fusion protein|nr:HlyD family efflux transporter periplasmic adaptor subunit [Timaviella obliquedivisa GSE-PSE-MK23-08B]